MPPAMRPTAAARSVAALTTLGPTKSRAARRRVTRSRYLPMRVTPGELATLERLADAPELWPERVSLATSDVARRLILEALAARGVTVVEPGP